MRVLGTLLLAMALGVGTCSLAQAQNVGASGSAGTKAGATIGSGSVGTHGSAGSRAGVRAGGADANASVGTGSTLKMQKKKRNGSGAATVNGGATGGANIR